MLMGWKHPKTFLILKTFVRFSLNFRKKTPWKKSPWLIVFLLKASFPLQENVPRKQNSWSVFFVLAGLSHQSPLFLYVVYQKWFVQDQSIPKTFNLILNSKSLFLIRCHCTRETLRRANFMIGCHSTGVVVSAETSVWSPRTLWISNMKSIIYRIKVCQKHLI